MIRKDAWNDFYFFEFTKARFMAQDVIYPGEGSVCTSEKGEIHCFGVKCLFSYLARRLNNALLNNQQIREEIKKEIKICIEMNENENTTTKTCGTQ